MSATNWSLFVVAQFKLFSHVLSKHEAQDFLMQVCSSYLVPNLLMLNARLVLSVKADAY